jgi:hypothetical protein
VGASVHAHGVLKRYTPFGDNSVIAIYFFSGARDFDMRVKGGGGGYFSSPSYYFPTFEPFGDFPTIRQGTVTVAFDPDQHGDDLKKSLGEQAAKNWRKLPRLVYENVVYLTFGTCWPAASSRNDLADRICKWERWIWCPLILVSLVGSVAYLVRRKLALVPLVTSGLIFSTYVLAQVATMEGRYRMPLEPLVLLAPMWLWERRRDPSPR